MLKARVLMFIMIVVLILCMANNGVYADRDLYNKGVDAMHRGDNETAKTIFKKIFTEDPDDYYAPYAMYQYARLLIDIDDVLHYLKKIISDYKDFNNLDMVYNDIGTIYFLRENYDISKRYFYYLYKNFPKNPLSIRGMFYVGKCFFNLDEDEKALKWYDALYRSFPKSYYAPLALFEMGFLYEKKRDFDRALVFYDKVLDEYPDSDAISKTLYRKALIYGAIKKELEKAYRIMALILVEYSGSFEADFVRKRLEGSISERAFIKLYYDGDMDIDEIDYQIESDGTIYDEFIPPDTIESDDKTFLQKKLSEKGKFFIQLGAFESTEGAEKYSDKINSDTGFPSFIIQKSLIYENSSNKLNLVIVGFFQYYDQAKQIEKKLKSKGFDCFIGERK
jgi:TolA-binding protein